jgi:hypothetical protein
MFEQNKALGKSNSGYCSELKYGSGEIVGNWHSYQEHRDENRVEEKCYKRRYNNSIKLGKTCIAPETLIKSQNCKNKNTEDCIDRRKMNVRT